MRDALETGPSGANESTSSLGLIRDRIYGPYFIAGLISNSGMWFQILASALIVYETSGSAFYVGLLTASHFVPFMLLSPLAGALADRVDRRRLIALGQGVAAVAAAALAAFVAAAGVGPGGVWPYVVSALLVGAGTSLTNPAAMALIPQLVDQADLEQALALNMVTFNLARGIGPAAATATLLVAGPSLAIGINAASFLVYIAVVLVVSPRQAGESTHEATTSRAVSAGWHHVRRNPGLSGLLVLATCLSFGVDPVQTLSPSLAERLLTGSRSLQLGLEAMTGMIMTSFGVGGAIGAVVGRRLRGRWGTELLSQGAFLVLAGGLILVSVSGSLVLMLLAMTITGAAFLTSLSSITAMLYQRTPSGLHGRVMAIWTIAYLGSRPLAATLDGLVADAVSDQAATLLAACVTLGGALALSRMVLPQLRRGESLGVAPPSVLAQVPEAGLPPSRGGR